MGVFGFLIVCYDLVVGIVYNVAVDACVQQFRKTTIRTKKQRMKKKSNRCTLKRDLPSPRNFRKWRDRCLKFN